MIKISGPAILLADGEIISEPSGLSSHAGLKEKLGYELPRHREGFLTTEGAFVNRWTAATIARAAGQVPYGVGSPKHGLCTSDLC